MDNKIPTYFRASLLILLYLFHPSLIAKNEADMAVLWDLSLAELLVLRMTSIASNTPSPINEQPAVVSIITEKDIQQSGARDLIDVLRLVPGFEFQYDVASVIGISFRGIWSIEGRILLMIDGMEFTGMLFGNTPFGQHFSVNQIEKIEIIRGPGAAKYGGNAQLAVIKITTKGKNMDGVETIITTGVMGSASAFNSVTVNSGKPLEQGFIKASLATSVSPHSTQTYTDFYGGEFDQEADSVRRTHNINLAGEYRELAFQLILDRYQQEQKDMFGRVLGLREVNFDNDMARIDYPWEINQEFTLIPSIEYIRQDNWRSRSLEDMTPFLGVRDIFLQIETELDRYQLQANYHPLEKMNINAGVMYQQERAHAKDTLEPISGVTADTIFNGSSNISYQTRAAFFQSDWKNDYGNWSIGGRYSKHSVVGESLVPRISYVKHWQQWHIKGLYSQSFREPEFSIIVLGGDTLVPETAKTSEVEAGYQLSPNTLLVLNAFYSNIEDPIIYSVVDTDFDTTTENYRNQTNMSSSGVEASWQWLPNWGKMEVGYSFYKAIDNPVPEYQVANNSDAFLGASQHKLSLNSRFKINQKFSINPSAIWNSARYGYDYNPSIIVTNPGDAQKYLKKFDAEITLNIFVSYQSGEFTLGSGIFDATNTKHQYTQAYDGGGAPMPGPGRMLFLKLTYTPEF